METHRCRPKRETSCNDKALANRAIAISTDWNFCLLASRMAAEQEIG